MDVGGKSDSEAEDDLVSVKFKKYDSTVFLLT
jgi:hypothetical protein